MRWWKDKKANIYFRLLPSTFSEMRFSRKCFALPRVNVECHGNFSYSQYFIEKLAIFYHFTMLGRMSERIKATTIKIYFQFKNIQLLEFVFLLLLLDYYQSKTINLRAEAVQQRMIVCTIIAVGRRLLEIKYNKLVHVPFPFPVLSQSCLSCEWRK